MRPPPKGWDPLDTLKTRTTIVPPFRMTTADRRANIVLTDISRSRPVDPRSLEEQRRTAGRRKKKKPCPPQEEEDAYC